MPGRTKVLGIGLGAAAAGFAISWMVVGALQTVKADRQVVADTPTPSPALNVKILPAKPTETPLPPGQSRVHVSLFGVKLTVSDPISDLTYGPVESGYTKLAGFTTESLLAEYPLCKPGVLGSLYRKQHVGPSPTPTPSHRPTPSSSATPKYSPSPSPVGKNGFVKTIGNFDYYYQQPGSALLSCTTDQFGRNALAEAKAAVINSALPTLAP
jgi:hypothetical protein